MIWSERYIFTLMLNFYTFSEAEETFFYRSSIY